MKVIHESRPSNRAIYIALYTLKQMCTSGLPCGECPLYVGGGECGIAIKNPRFWKLQDPPRPWAAFADAEDDDEEEEEEEGED